MKKLLLLILLFISVGFTTIQAQCNKDSKPTSKATSMGIVIYSNDPETVWNALRLANYLKSEGDTLSNAKYISMKSVRQKQQQPC